LKVLSINIGQAKPLKNAKASGQTGIYKEPVKDSVWISKLGLKGDTICDTENHGGVDQAVYIYGAKDYSWWTYTLSQDFRAGMFGENLTLSELESASFAIGDRLAMGEVLLEVTAPRIPCVTLATRMADPKFAKRFKEAERPGLYCRVLNEGFVKQGDEVRLEPYTGDRISVIQMFRDFYRPQLSEQELRRYLAVPIAIRDRVEKEKNLKTLLGPEYLNP
jgi:MOSC domain-containing protein YiiM